MWFDSNKADASSNLAPRAKFAEVAKRSKAPAC
jgi:hypothetical protein